MKIICPFLFVLIASYSLSNQVVNIPDPVFKAILMSANETNSSCMLANEQNLENLLTLWPNPVTDIFQLKVPTNFNSFSITLYNQLGQY